MVDGFDDDYGYQAFYDSVDVLLMGSKTYTQVREFGDWPYPGKMTYVFSSRDLPDPPHGVTVVGPDLQQTLRTLKRYNKLWLVGGAGLVKSFHQAGLIDEYIISLIPVILGEGIALFKPPLKEQALNLQTARHYPSGLVQMHYQKNSIK